MTEINDGSVSSPSTRRQAGKRQNASPRPARTPGARRRQRQVLPWGRVGARCYLEKKRRGKRKLRKFGGRRFCFCLSPARQKRLHYPRDAEKLSFLGRQWKDALTMMTSGRNRQRSDWPEPLCRLRRQWPSGWSTARPLWNYYSAPNCPKFSPFPPQTAPKRPK